MIKNLITKLIDKKANKLNKLSIMDKSAVLKKRSFEKTGHLKIHFGKVIIQNFQVAPKLSYDPLIFLEQHMCPLKKVASENIGFFLIEFFIPKRIFVESIIQKNLKEPPNSPNLAP